MYVNNSLNLEYLKARIGIEIQRILSDVHLGYCLESNQLTDIHNYLNECKKTTISNFIIKMGVVVKKYIECQHANLIFF